MLVLKGGQVTLDANWEKWQKHYVLAYTLHTWSVFHCLLHMLWTSVYFETYTDERNWSLVAETDTNSIFKILWLNPLLVLGSSIVFNCFNAGISRRERHGWRKRSSWKCWNKGKFYERKIVIIFAFCVWSYYCTGVDAPLQVNKWIGIILFFLTPNISPNKCKGIKVLMP